MPPAGEARWNTDASAPTGKDGVTRGCRMACPSTTRPGQDPQRAVQRMRHLADQAADRIPRQARVGIERDDIAHLTGTAGGLPATGKKPVSAAPRSNRFISCSLPRLRSQPIHTPSASFHTRRRRLRQVLRHDRPHLLLHALRSLLIGDRPNIAACIRRRSNQHYPCPSPCRYFPHHPRWIARAAQPPSPH